MWSSNGWEQNGWQDRAACRDKPKDMFFPRGDPRSPSYKQAVQAAVAVCAGCEVTGPCREAGSTSVGIWAGLDANQRGVTLRHVTLEEHGTPAAYRRHYKRGEKPCDACRDAHNERQYRWRKRDVA